MKYQGKTIVQIAQERGSTAKTRTGAWKYLLKHLPGPARPRNSAAYDWNSWTQYCRDRTGDGRARVLGYNLFDPNTPGRILEEAYDMHRAWRRRAAVRIERDAHGAMIATPLYDWSAQCNSADLTYDHLYWGAVDLLDEAKKKRRIEPSYNHIEFDRRGRASGSAVHHDIYDYANGAAVICLRKTLGTRYGVATSSKQYLLITRAEDGEIAVLHTTEPVAKLAKSGVPLGSIIKRILGLHGGATLCLKWDEVFKALALVDGELRSIYNGEPYALGKTKRQRAVDNHGGGYYCYASPEEAKACEVPENSVYRTAPRVIVRCEAAGARILYGNGKMARTYLRPIEIIPEGAL